MPEPSASERFDSTAGAFVGPDALGLRFTLHEYSGGHVAVPETGTLRRDLGFAVPWGSREGYGASMALMRILVDGYSLLHGWPELAPGHARFSAFAREELLRKLTCYQDAVGTPITVFFDGSGPSVSRPAEANPALEVLYSKSGQTADQLIERVAHRFAPYGEVLAVTDDRAERETVLSLGGMASSCVNFIQTVENTLAELADDIKSYNRQERNRFQRRR
jgi:uncharacterized protein